MQWPEINFYFATGAKIEVNIGNVSLQEYKRVLTTLNSLEGLRAHWNDVRITMSNGSYYEFRPYDVSVIWVIYPITPEVIIAIDYEIHKREHQIVPNERKGPSGLPPDVRTTDT